MFIKENFWVGAKGGLIEEKHYLCMRESIWLYLFLLLKQTGVNEAGEGIVNHGHPMTRKYIQEETGFHERRIEDWIDRLRRTDYIRTEFYKQDGLSFFIKAAKHKTKVSRQNVPPRDIVAHTDVPHPLERASQEQQNKTVKLVGGTPIPKNLSYYNKAAAGAVIKSLSKQKKIPKPRSWEDQKAEMRMKGFL